MNNISKLARIGKNVRLGVNNTIGDNVFLGDNVVIGSNNRIFSNNTIYPNVELGDNNVILEGNVLGEHPVDMNDFNDKLYNGVKIGNNNYFHCNSVIFGGTKDNKTIIGNNNKLSHRIHIGHDCTITDNVHIYPNVIISGYSTLLSNSGIGINSSIKQYTVIGNYSFIGMGASVTKHIFPYYIYAGNKYLRMNTKRVPDDIYKYNNELYYIAENYKSITEDEITQQLIIFPNSIKQDLIYFFNKIKNI